MSKPFYITTTLPYVNAPLHLGHALEFVRADAIARYKKLAGFDVYFNTGTDEHGLKIFNKAQAKSLTPQEFVDQGFATFQEQLKMFGVSEDIHFTRTTGQVHQLAVQEFWRQVSDNGYIYKKNYQAKYCVGCESEKTDSELNEQGECPLHPGQPLELIDEENYFFKYSALGDRLLDFYAQNPNFVIPDLRFNEVKSFVKNGLQDFSISRLKSKMPWGIAVPDDPDQVIYVWFDALVNYLSTLGWPCHAEAFGEGGTGNKCLYEKYWVGGTPTQYCGKDNNRFQSIMWQAMLLAAGLPNSHQVIVNGFITGEGGIRMSKTLGNVVDPRDLAQEYGTDALRYFLLREVNSFEDSPFTIERFKEAYNAGLANGLGNLTSRIMKMAEMNGINIKELPDFLGLPEVKASVDDHLNNFELNKAMDEIWGLVSLADQKIQKEKPFSLIKTSPDLAKEIMRSLVYDLNIIAYLLKPFMPETSFKIQEAIKSGKMPEPLFLRR
ncbi:MAG: methionine--tRNA ligase [Candidatus Paceibacterota bacterium]|jgi:methionyl-tRNA synthetase